MKKSFKKSKAFPLLFSIILFSFISIHLSGQTWSTIKRLTWNSGTSQYPSISADSGSGIHVVWHDNTPGNFEIYYKKSTDSGAIWLGPVRLTWNSGDSNEPSIAADSSNGIHVVWEDKTWGNKEIIYKRSTDGGASWLGIKRLTWNSGWSYIPSIAADSGSGIHVVWYDSTPMNNEIFYKNSTDGGASWSGLTRLTWNKGNSTKPNITADSGIGIHMVWQDDTPGNSEIFYKNSTDGGGTWSGPMRLTWNGGNSWTPSIAVDSSNGIHVVWFDNTPGNYEIYYKHSTNSGSTWSGPIRMTWNGGVSSNPSIAAVSSSGIHVLWDDDTPGNAEIFYKNSTNGGATWSGLTRLTWNTGWSYIPSIAPDSGNGIHVVWFDNTPPSYEIFYKNRK